MTWPLSPTRSVRKAYVNARPAFGGRSWLDHIAPGKSPKAPGSHQGLSARVSGQLRQSPVLDHRVSAAGRTRCCLLEQLSSSVDVTGCPACGTSDPTEDSSAHQQIACHLER